MPNIPLFGQCDSCQDTDMPLTKWGEHYYCKFCLKVKKDSLSSTIKAIEKPVDDFNRMVRKCQS